MTIHSALIQKLLSTNAHLGKRVAQNHFKIYSAGSRNAMTVIDSDKTLICLRSACDFIGSLVRDRARFIFVNTNTLFDDIIDQMTKTIGCRNDTSWRLGGFLTNSSSPRKFRSRKKKFNLTSVQAPDCVVIFDTDRKSSVIEEASRLQIPIVGLVDSSTPWDTYKKITYPIPANDSVQFVYLFCNLITKTFLHEQKKLNAAGTREDVQFLDQCKTAATKDKVSVLPYENLEPLSEDLSETKQLLDKLVVLNFSGNLGTDMGSNKTKCANEISDEMACLDVIINNIESLNSKYGCNIPLLLMSTVNTEKGIQKVLAKHSNKNIYSLLQHHEETSGNDVHQQSQKPSPKDELYPSNLNEVFISLKKSWKLDVLLSQGKEYILLVQPDNLADLVDPKILSHLIRNNIQYCVEVLPTTFGAENSDFAREQKVQVEDLKSTKKLWMNMNLIESLARRTSLNFSISEFLNRPFAVAVPKPEVDCV
ncbi:PREDICTED: UTP--glucose-1-phosphate uridylyltransferase [Ipomoea nil]|uniref:UTP--glucose-1-phosphate uridylyltransferase n=1 Tax=Ipomoea nil TaxID=35883 RepID=UPI00090199E4|nr:PREDICTED: UTP--glucose-1-phosphate uridylyltransferase [Ipomoea nil]